MNTPVPTNYTRVFELLAYASLALDAVSAIVQDRDMATITTVCLVVLLIAALIWATARRGYRWAAGLLLVWVAYSFADSLSEHWTGAPEWLHRVFPPSEKVSIRLMSSASLALMGVAMVIYFSKLTNTRTPQA
jgi:hypothetical protein